MKCFAARVGDEDVRFPVEEQGGDVDCVEFVGCVEVLYDGFHRPETHELFVGEGAVHEFFDEFGVGLLIDFIEAQRYHGGFDGGTVTNLQHTRPHSLDILLKEGIP